MAWHLAAVPLPDGDAVADRWLDGAGWSDSPLPGAEHLPGRWALPGLVDAHSHVSLLGTPTGPRFGDRADAERARDLVSSRP